MDLRHKKLYNKCLRLIKLILKRNTLEVEDFENTYESPLNSRYASKEMQELFLPT